jgi:hypothetical protein
MSSGFDLLSGALKQLLFYSQSFSILAFNTLLVFFAFCMQSRCHGRTPKQSSPTFFMRLRSKQYVGFCLISVLCCFCHFYHAIQEDRFLIFFFTSFMINGRGFDGF